MNQDLRQVRGSSTATSSLSGLGGDDGAHVGAQPDGAGFRFTRVDLSISPPTSVSVVDPDDDGEPEVVLREAGHLAILQPRSLAWR